MPEETPKDSTTNLDSTQNKPAGENPVQLSDKPAKSPLTPKEKKKRIILWTLGGLVILIVLGLLGYTIYRRYYVGTKKLPEKISLIKPAPTSPTKVPAETKVASPINGEMVPDYELKNHPLAVMIENHPDARPQSGLINAAAVYEAITEGGITRFMAVFMQNGATQVGPVRSARSFFIDWASEYSAYYAHAGGAADALAKIPNSNIYDLGDTIGYFSRINYNKVASEHTLYSSTANLYKLAQKKNYPSEINVDSLLYKDDAAKEQRGPKTKIDINFSTSSYEVGWNFDSINNNYLRTLAGSAHKDRTTGQQITAKVVAVLTVSRHPIHLPGAKATFEFDDIGSGPVKIFQDGQEVDGTWKKTDQKSRTRFYDSQGKEIELDRGTIWYEIVPPETPVTVS